MQDANEKRANYKPKKAKDRQQPPEAGEGQALLTPPGSTPLADNLTSVSKFQHLQRTLWLFGNPFGSDSLGRIRELRWQTVMNLQGMHVECAQIHCDHFSTRKVRRVCKGSQISGGFLLTLTW